MKEWRMACSVIGGLLDGGSGLAVHDDFDFSSGGVGSMHCGINGLHGRGCGMQHGQVLETNKVGRGAVCVSSGLDGGGHRDARQ
jgi:hypothetical protein